jgi:phospholipase C
MSFRKTVSKCVHGLRIAFVAVTVFQFSLGGPLASSAKADEHGHTATPIKHIIVIVGENRSFDHLFATYKPKDGESVDNLLAKHIINEDGSPGPKYSLAHQFSADAADSPTFQLAPKNKTLFDKLPAPLTTYQSDVCVDDFFVPSGTCTLDQATDSENGLAPEYYPSMLIGGSGLPSKVPDSRISGVNSSVPYSTLPPGPFQLTNTKTTDKFPYTSYAASPVHRFYQMWQQFDCDTSHISKSHPNGCLADLFTWTEVSVGSNNNGKPQPANFSLDYSPTASTTGEGATAMGFYNMHQGDAPYTKHLADHYAMSDNYHQPAMGGTGLDEIMLYFADPIYFTDGKGHPATPPHNANVPGFGGPVDEIEDPNPVPGTNNFWIQDGYGGFGNLGASTGVYGGGSYTDCSDPTQPGVAPILNYLKSLPRPIEPKCDPDHYYLLNNYNPGYFGDGSDASKDTNSNNTPFTIPPTNQRSIGDVLLENHISWKSYNDQWNQYVGLNGFAPDPYQLKYETPAGVGEGSDQYCNICNGFQYQTQIMTDKKLRTEHLKDTVDLYKDIANGTLPAVSFVKPSGWVDGHPASSKWDLFEGFVKKIVEAVKANPELWESTAIFVTTDEGGGYYDSGYTQILDYFGDGTRIPMIVVSPYTKPGHISHQYSDHVSVLKFIERNWNLPTITGRSRDNLPNPKTNWDNPYVPENSPAIGDLFDLFDFDHHDGDHEHD